ncbi:hypothetical protein PHET_02207 [Paragonimus heterotremus]|uniref:Uncharacterized protein n=1 Tax=Paragonimus heterotremus TaxID=100268 RepID=A0A8J4SSL6_9TREM|nr:hypothetical protein PHET_02207 [Paragonimus heterotremus]
MLFPQLKAVRAFRQRPYTEGEKHGVAALMHQKRQRLSRDSLFQKQASEGLVSRGWTNDPVQSGVNINCKEATASSFHSLTWNDTSIDQPLLATEYGKFDHIKEEEEYYAEQLVETDEENRGVDLRPYVELNRKSTEDCTERDVQYDDIQRATSAVTKQTTRDPLVIQLDNTDREETAYAAHSTPTEESPTRMTYTSYGTGASQRRSIQVVKAFRAGIPSRLDLLNRSGLNNNERIIGRRSVSSGLLNRRAAPI